MREITVIGLGSMGSQLARVLIEYGYFVTVWNRSAEKAQPHIRAGATLAPSAAEAIKASDITIICIGSHNDTHTLLQQDPAVLAGKTIIELSTGGANEARSLSGWIESHGANCLIGMISTFPKGIGKPDSAIITAGPVSVWQDCAAVVKILAGNSSHIGSDFGAIAALFAALFLPRQGFMFGMIYGALICEKFGISMDDYVKQIPLTLNVVHDYYDLFAATVPGQNFSDPPSSMETYLGAFQDVLDTFKSSGVTHELPELLHSLAQRGVDAGLAAEQITALTKILRK